MSKCTSIISKVLPAFCFSIAILVGGNAMAADPGKYGKDKKVVQTKEDAMRSITFLPRGVSKSLKILRVPTSEPIPLIIGHYWDCAVNDQGLETCDSYLVACTDDQSFCVRTP